MTSPRPDRGACGLPDISTYTKHHFRRPSRNGPQECQQARLRLSDHVAGLAVGICVSPGRRGTTRKGLRFFHIGPTPPAPASSWGAAAPPPPARDPVGGPAPTRYLLPHS